MPKQLLDKARVNRQAIEVTTFAEAEQTDLHIGVPAAPMSGLPRWN